MNATRRLYLHAKNHGQILKNVTLILERNEDGNWKYQSQIKYEN